MSSGNSTQIRRIRRICTDQNLRWLKQSSMRTRVKQHEDELSPIRIGISRCLLGDPVRYDGAHKHDQFLTDTLGRYFEWVPVCPEVEVGMGTPREPIQLVQLGNNIRLLGRSSEMDHTNS